MASQTMRRIHVSKGRAIIWARHTKAPAIGIHGKKGHRKGLSTLGRVFRRTRMLKHTMVKARRVPMETSSPRTPIGRTPAMNAANSPVMTVVTCGVPNLG